MYRQYEDIHHLERELNLAKQELFTAMYYNEDDDRIISLREDVADLEERLNFAIQDMESEEEIYF